MGLGSIVSSAVNRVRDVAQGVGNAVRNTVRTAESIAPTVSQLNSATRNITGRLLGGDPISDITRTAARTTQNLVSSTGNNVARGLFGNNPVRDLVNRGREFVSNQVNRVAGNVINNIVNAGRNFVGGIIDRGREILSNVGNRIVDAGRTAFNSIKESVVGIGRSFVEGAGQFFSGVGQVLNPAPLAKVFQGDFSGAWNDFRNNVSNGFQNMGGGLVKATLQPILNTGVELLNGAVSSFQTLVGLEPPSRPLNEQEIAELRSVYGDTVDYSQIRIKEGHLGIANGLAPHTIGNTIYIPQRDGQQRTVAQRNNLLVHEAAHVWQYQNGGTDYISESLWHQAVGAIGSGNRDAAYEFEGAIRNGTTWADLNPEQQGHLIDEAYNRGMFSNPNATFLAADGTDITTQVRAAINEMRNGRGAA